MAKVGRKKIGFNNAWKLGAVFSILYMGMAIGQWEIINCFLGLVVGLLDLRWDHFGLDLS